MTGPILLPREDHPISRKDIDHDTLRVLYRLKDAGFAAYLVGGAVRDLLMGRRPKDFDIATDARPGDLRRIFRNSRVVGRRFKIVHVFFGPKNIEVATLRSAVEPPEDADDLYIEDDNQWGDLESDAFRRDFTCNALYYDIHDFAVIDYTGGLEDLRARRLRTIGDPQVRFREDPVRMLRAVKFAARFGWEIEAGADAAIRDHQSDILKASRFRVTEEIFRILGQANRHSGVQMLGDYGFFGALWPEWLAAVGDEGMEQIEDFFATVDRDALDERFYPMELLTAGLFLPFLGTIDPGRDQFNRVAGKLTEEIRRHGVRMDLPKRLINAVVELLRGQLYLLYFAHMPKRVSRFVESDWFDPCWRLHLLAFRGLPELAEVQGAWEEARKRIRRPLGGLVGGPDRRDIFSFRGRTGGGRHSRGRDDQQPDVPGEAGADEGWAEPALVDAGDE